MTTTIKFPELKTNIGLYASAFEELRKGRRPAWLPEKLTPYEALNALGLVYYARAMRSPYSEVEEHGRLQMAHSLVESQFYRQIHGNDYFRLDLEDFPKRAVKAGFNPRTTKVQAGILWENEKLRGDVFEQIHRRFDRALQQDPTGISAIGELSGDFDFASDVELVTGVGCSQLKRLRKDYEVLVQGR